MNKYYVSLMVMALAGCGGGGGGGSGGSGGGGTSSTILNGYAADGYLVGASVCLDEDSNNLCAGEADFVVTDSSGNFTLDITGRDADATVLAKALVDVTTDLDNPGSTIATAFTLRSNTELRDESNRLVITPLTTILQLQLENDANNSINALIADSRWVSRLCPFDTTTAAKRSCLLQDYVALSSDSNSRTAFLAQRQHKFAQAVNQLLIDADNQATRTQIAQIITQRSLALINAIDTAIGANDGNVNAVSASQIAANYPIVTAEGETALANVLATPSSSVATTTALGETLYRFSLRGTAVNGDSITPNGAERTLASQFPYSDFNNPNSTATGNQSSGANFVSITAASPTQTLKQFQTGATQLTLNGQAMAQLLDTWSPSPVRQWQSILPACTEFTAGAEAYVLPEIAGIEINNPAYGFYNKIEPAQIPNDGDLNTDFATLHDMEQIISNYTAEVQPFTVYIGPEVKVILGTDGSADYYYAVDPNNPSSDTLLGTVGYAIEPLVTPLGTATVAVLRDFGPVGNNELYIDRSNSEILGIGVSTNEYVAAYQPVQTSGRINSNSTRTWALALFGMRQTSTPRLYLNATAASQVQAEINDSVLSDANGSTTGGSCSYSTGS